MRRAKDREEFERFMNERRNRPQAVSGRLAPPLSRDAGEGLSCDPTPYARPCRRIFIVAPNTRSKIVSTCLR